MLRTSTPSHSHGFSLVELMVAVTLSLLLLASALHLHALNAKTLRLLEQDHLLDAALVRVMHLVLSEARRAGYHAGEGPPWRVHGDILHIDSDDGAGISGCLLYAYDRDGDGLRGVGREGPIGPGRDRNNVEEFGIRLHQGRVQIRLGGSAHDCRSGRWAALTPPEVRFTELDLRLIRDLDGTHRLQVRLEAALGSRQRALESATWLPNA